MTGAERKAHLPRLLSYTIEPSALSFPSLVRYRVVVSIEYLVREAHCVWREDSYRATAVCAGPGYKLEAKLSSAAAEIKVYVRSP